MSRGPDPKGIRRFSRRCAPLIWLRLALAPPKRALIQLREGRFTSNVAVPDVGELSLDEACWLTDHGILPGVATLDDKVAGTASYQRTSIAAETTSLGRAQAP
jgi:hypothetical protein